MTLMSNIDWLVLDRCILSQARNFPCCEFHALFSARISRSSTVLIKLIKLIPFSDLSISFYIWRFQAILSYSKHFSKRFQDDQSLPGGLARAIRTLWSNIPRRQSCPGRTCDLCHIYVIYVITSHMLGIFGDPYWNLKMPTTLWKNELWALSSRDFLGWISIDIVWYGMILYDIVLLSREIWFPKVSREVPQDRSFGSGRWLCSLSEQRQVSVRLWTPWGLSGWRAHLRREAREARGKGAWRPKGWLRRRRRRANLPICARSLMSNLVQSRPCRFMFHALPLCTLR